MSTRVSEGFGALTEKEKQTLRLIVRGHDAKSIARSLGLSVHTINERLRDARRKMAVSSSREAARLLLEVEDAALAVQSPDLLGDTDIGADAACSPVDPQGAPIGGAWRAHRQPWIIGVSAMMITFGMLALATLSQVPSSPSSMSPAAEVAPKPEVLDAAQRWLALVDQGRWDDAYRETGAAFRKLNTVQVWTDTSEKVRAQFGATISRTFVSEEDLPAPPAGYEVLKFRAAFANKADTVETVSLDYEDGRWRVVGVTIG
jgi:DNA-binding CsgD family transcriptional regulator